MVGRRWVAETILRSPFIQERTRTPRDAPAYPLPPTDPIAGATDWTLTVVESAKGSLTPERASPLTGFPYPTPGRKATISNAGEGSPFRVQPHYLS